MYRKATSGFEPLYLSNDFLQVFWAHGSNHHDHQAKADRLQRAISSRHPDALLLQRSHGLFERLPRTAEDIEGRARE